MIDWPVKSPKKIIVRVPNWLGDAVMATPILADLRAHFPLAEITAMSQSNVSPLLKYDPNINEILSYKKPNGWIHRRKHFEIIEQLRKGEYDLGLLLTNSWSSAWWFWRGRVKNRIGFAANLRSILLDKAVPFPEKRETQHLVITYKNLVEPLNIPLSNTSPTLYVTEKEKEEAKKRLALYSIDLDKHTLVGINPGAAYGTAKCWLPERFEAITRRLLEDPNTYVIFFGDTAGAPVVNDICKKLPDRVANLAAKTSIRELMALITCCNAFLTNDSGPMHIAAALRTPLLALFGSTNDTKTGPNPIGKVIHKHVECSPCYKRVCPIDFRCMKKIEVDEVYRELKKILEKK